MAWILKLKYEILGVLYHPSHLLHFELGFMFLNLGSVLSKHQKFGSFSCCADMANDFVISNIKQIRLVFGCSRVQQSADGDEI